ncbi:LCP family protein [Paenibacillus sp. J5C2022]|uniref:LCP family protein n=1 Tax=Paenibacillus sp. J5C2022 TaxID=2977129 RepID=UPI0021CF6F20|nr:LCP family protein [Paenibacillus sp. J5C2022]
MWRKKRFYMIIALLFILGTTAYMNRGALAMMGFDWFLQGHVEGKLKETYKPLEGREPTVVSKKKQDPFSVLLLGIDQRGNEIGRSDSLLYTVVRPSDGRMLLVSIPRDLYVELVGRERKDKINHSYAFGGAGMTMDTVEKLFDAPVDHYASINFEGFRDVIDAIGGIALPIEDDIVNDDPGHEHFVIKGGQDLYNGVDALNFVRYREDSDMNRTERHQQFLHAIIEKATKLKQWSKIPSLIDIMGDNFSTDIPPDKLVDQAQQMLSSKQLQMYSHTLNGKGARLKSGGAWYYFADEEDLADVQAMIQNWLDPNVPSSQLILPPKYASDDGMDKGMVAQPQGN